MAIVTNLFDDEPELASDAKALGAYYTDSHIADFLAWWAIRSPTDTMLDPSFGGGVFLRSGCRRIHQLGGRSEDHVYGVEIDPKSYRRTVAQLTDEYAVNREHLLLVDFFHVDPSALRVDAAIGNPPFIRYQRFSGEVRSRALARSLAEGVRLPKLCSSWAPFLVHTIAMVRPGGRLAMVLPREVGHAQYARPVLEHLRRAFGTALFLTFRRKLFPDLSEDTVLLLASNRGAGPARFLWHDLEDSAELLTWRDKGCWPPAGLRSLDAEAIATGDTRLIEYLIPERARSLYHELRRSGRGRRLGALADVGIGYVTGANDFFHLDPDEARWLGIPDEFLKPAIRRGRALAGLRLTPEDWSQLVRAGQAGLLLHIEKGRRLPATVREYLDHGEARGIPAGYKCRTRSPWYCVPHVYRPDGFLTYMSGVMPRLVANDAGVYATNSLHILRLRPPRVVSSDTLAALWQTSLTRLSVEIEGHALGGGLLKLEPTEAENVLVPFPAGKGTAPELVALAAELDRLARDVGDDAARIRADEVVLQGMMGLDKDDCDLLNVAARTLRGRRGYGGAIDESA